MTNPMIERVAEVLASNAGDGRDYSDVARAVIESLREPTPAMGDAFMGSTGDDPNWSRAPDQPQEFFGTLEGFRESWADAIDAALKEE